MRVLEVDVIVEPLREMLAHLTREVLQTNTTRLRLIAPEFLSGLEPVLDDCLPSALHLVEVLVQTEHIMRVSLACSVYNTIDRVLHEYAHYLSVIELRLTECSRLRSIDE